MRPAIEEQRVEVAGRLATHTTEQGEIDGVPGICLVRWLGAATHQRYSYHDGAHGQVNQHPDPVKHSQRPPEHSW
jgi:hypothetical protein